MNNLRIDIRKLSLTELQQNFVERGEKSFRAQQVYEWLWKKSITSFDDMSNLSKELRDYLNINYCINAVSIHQTQVSSDNTIKYAFKLYDDNLVEGVLIPTEDRMTACVSSQVGCSLSCKFCATGYMERKRNLDFAEIYDQVALIAQESLSRYQIPLSNVVFMGMGEPMLNYNNTIQAIDKITSHQGLGMASKRITVSTAGIAKMIQKLGDDGVKFNLALSLHAANDTKRNKIMPINEQNSLSALLEALHYYYEKTKNKITYEYIVFDNFNDDIEDAKELLKFCKKIPCKVNIIEYNPIPFATFINTNDDKLQRFAKYLQNNGIVTVLRRSRGKDIDAACGQLVVNSSSSS